MIWRLLINSKESLPDNVLEYDIKWEYCDSFDEAVKKITYCRYDVVVTDIYRDRQGVSKGDLTEQDAQAVNIIELVRNLRFCPVVAFTDGPLPANIQEGPFIKCADKSGGNDKLIARLEELLDTGIPAIAKKLHDELDDIAGPSYLWKFLEKNWDSLRKNGHVDHAVLERLVRKRAAIQLGRLNLECPNRLKSIGRFLDHGIELICP